MKKSQWLAQIVLTILLTLFGSETFAKTAKHPVMTDKKVGVASYFNDKFHGQRTASGERYDKNALTAAHATLPFGSMIKVVNLKNHHSVNLRVNSRPHAKNKRMLDVSKQAAKQLGFLRSGLAKVEITVLQLGNA
ncbi:MAG: septal ring lytic transglycosylase RlpA family protein [Methylomonas sp.]